MNKMHNKLAVLIPCFNVSNHIKAVIEELPAEIALIIAVDDCSTDNTLDILRKIQEQEPRLSVVEHRSNQGVGGAMITAFQEALKSGCEYFVKMDGDGQMDASFINDLLSKLETQNADFAKGNRFHDLTRLAEMPFVRRSGNFVLGFLIKGASGYWDISDPTNGFFCITRATLSRLNLKRLSKRYFFESSLIIELYYVGARIVDVPMPALYGSEVSNLSITKTIFTFPQKLFRAFVRRIALRYFIYDFNMASVYILLGLPLFSFGVIFGILNWVKYHQAGVSAPTGTIILALLTVVLGFQLLLSAIQNDIENGKFKS